METAICLTNKYRVIVKTAENMVFIFSLKGKYEL